MHAFSTVRSTHRIAIHLETGILLLVSAVKRKWLAYVLLVSAVKRNGWPMYCLFQLLKEMAGLCIAIHLEMRILLPVSAVKRNDWPM